MSSVVIQGDTSGQVTIAAPAVAGTTTLTLPATTGTVLNDATVGVCRAWVNFSGVTSTSVKASFNVSSVTYVSTGKYTINFTTAMTDANYAIVGMTTGLANSGGGKMMVENSSGSGGTIGRTASACTVLTVYSFSNPGAPDENNAYSNSVAVFR